MGTELAHFINCRITPTTVINIFSPRATPYKLRNPVSFEMRKVHSVCNGIGTLSHLRPKIWTLVPLEKDSLYHLVILKQILKCTPSNCSYRPLFSFYG